MADFCKEADEGLYWPEQAGQIILCEGHGRYERLDDNGIPVTVSNFFGSYQEVLDQEAIK